MAATVIFDVILIVLIAAGIIVGAKRGFIATVAKPVKLVLSIFLAFTLDNFVADSLIKPTISSSVTTKLSSFLLEKYSSVTAATSGELPLLIRLAAAMAGVDPEYIEAEGEAYIVQLVDKVTDPVITILSLIIAWILLYIVFRIVLSLLLKLINSLVEDGVVGAANRITGCIVTTLLAFAVSWCVVAVTDFIFHMPASQSVGWIADFNGGFMYDFYKSISPLELLLSF